MYFIKTEDGSSRMNIDNWNIHFDETTTYRILSYFRKTTLYPDSLDALQVDGIEDDSLSYVSVVFDDMTLTIDDGVSMYIISEDDIDRAIFSLEDLANDSNVIF